MIPATLGEAPRQRRDLAIGLLALALLLGWELAGWDLPVAQWYGSTGGFALRNDWWTQRVLHDGGRVLSGIVLVAALLLAWRPPWASHGPRGRRFAMLGLVFANLMLVPLLKHFSRTSCPWDLDLFGGSARYVPHWMLAVVDGGPGRCFPSGHAVAAFAFLPLYFYWRTPRPFAARVALALVFAFGALFGWAQLARGAHFPSHTMWSAWLCWVVAATGTYLVERAGRTEVLPPGTLLEPVLVSVDARSDPPLSSPRER